MNKLKRPGALVAAVVPASLLLASINPSSINPELPPSASRPALRYSDLSVPEPVALPAHSIVLTVEAGDTLDSVLTEGGVDRMESAAVIREIARSLDLRRLRPGNLVRFHYQQDGRVDSIELKVTGWGEIDAVRTESGFLVVPQVATQNEIDTVISASIESSLYDALKSEGEGPQLAQQIADICQWDVDFFALQRGDSFSMVVKKKFVGSDAVG